MSTLANSTWMIYGAYGYTGRLIVEESVRRGYKPILAGRNANKLAELAQRHGLEWQAMSLADPKILVALVSWGLYSFALFARKAIGWSGRRAAYLSGIAFAIVLLNFVLVGYFLTASHNF